jgi:hypothetical protein
MEVQKDPPLLTVMSLSLKTMLNPKNNQNEIVMISGIVHQQGTSKLERKEKKNI